MVDGPTDKHLIRFLMIGLQLCANVKCSDNIV